MTKLFTMGSLYFDIPIVNSFVIYIFLTLNTLIQIGNHKREVLVLDGITCMV
jgi:hypothetical protein